MDSFCCDGVMCTKLNQTVEKTTPHHHQRAVSALFFFIDSANHEQHRCWKRIKESKQTWVCVVCLFWRLVYSDCEDSWLECCHPTYSEVPQQHSMPSTDCVGINQNSVTVFIFPFFLFFCVFVFNLMLKLMLMGIWLSYFENSLDWKKCVLQRIGMISQPWLKSEKSSFHLVISCS